MNLLLIESPGKVETIKKYLGSNYEVIATKGHIRDLPAKTLAVDVANNFLPTYEIIPDKKSLAKTLLEKAKKAENIYLATDPDREGEAISWHLCNILGIMPSEAKRITFNAITKDAITEGIAAPTKVNMNLVDAQQARRILDRLIGYKLSPLISKKIRSKLSAGRVQSVALKIVVEREKAIKDFKPEEYWDIVAKLQTNSKITFKSELATKNGKKFLPSNKQQADSVLTAVKSSPFAVANVKRGVTTQNAPAPYITSTLQQDAVNRLKMTLKSFTTSAQTLYEGVHIEGEGKTALVTYIRTDSTRVAPNAQSMAKEFILNNFGKEYVPDKPNIFKSKKSAQDAHEAIRPVSLKYTPEYLHGKIDAYLLKLYTMIFNRFLASQMPPAKYDSLSIEIRSADYGFKSTGRTVIFEGFTKVYKVETEEKTDILPDLKVGENLKLADIISTQKFTKPPARYTEASLVKELDEKGIGRPATFAATVLTLFNRQYTVKENKFIMPTELGIQVVDYLEKYFKDLMNIKFTAEMEEKLDEIEFGGNSWQNTIKDFYNHFEVELKEAYVLSEKIKQQLKESDILCEKCGAKMVYREGRFGQFLACPNFPKCRNTKPIEDSKTDEIKSKFTGICPKCGGTVSEKRSKRGKIFFGCDNYPNCDFMSWDLPLKEKCEACGEPLYSKVYKDKLGAPKCINKECKNFVNKEN